MGRVAQPSTLMLRVGGHSLFCEGYWFSDFHFSVVLNQNTPGRHKACTKRVNPENWMDNSEHPAKAKPHPCTPRKNGAPSKAKCRRVERGAPVTALYRAALTGSHIRASHETVFVSWAFLNRTNPRQTQAVCRDCQLVGFELE